MIETLRTWISEPMHQAALMSAFFLLVAVVAYLLGRRRVTEGKSEAADRARRRLLQLGIFGVLLMVLLRIWLRFLSGRASEVWPPHDLSESLFWTCAAAALVYVATLLVRRTLLREVTAIETRHKIRRTILWVGTAVFLVIAAMIWASRIEDVGVFLGIVGAGLALSLQETLLCIAGWALIVVRRPFDIGDRIEVDGRRGDVIDVGLFHSSLLEVGNWVDADQSTGRMLILPNSMVLRHAVYNYTKGFPFIWNEFSAIVTFESDWRAAKALMLQQAEEEAERLAAEVRSQIEKMQNQYAIHYERLSPIVYTSIADVGVRLTLRYLSPVRQRRATTHRVSEGILDAFLAHPTVDFAYPTIRYYNHPAEGKEALGGGVSPAARPEMPHAEE